MTPFKSRSKIKLVGFLSIFLTVSQLAEILTPSTLSAQVRCKADVHYSWKKKTEGQNKTAAGSEEQEGRRLLFSTIEVEEETEEAGQLKIQSLLSKEAYRAREECLRRHENLSGCIAGKFQALSVTMQQLDFEARREIQKSIRQDCNNQQGECLKAFWDEISCVAVGDQEAEEGEEEKG